MGAPIRIVVVDDHPLFRQGLITLLERSGMNVVGTASSVLETIERGVRLRPDVVLMDLELKDGSGILATRRLLDAVGGGVKVVMLSESHDPQVMLAAVRALSLRRIAFTCQRTVSGDRYSSAAICPVV